MIQSSPPSINQWLKIDNNTELSEVPSNPLDERLDNISNLISCNTSVYDDVLTQVLSIAEKSPSIPLHLVGVGALPVLLFTLSNCQEVEHLGYFIEVLKDQAALEQPYELDKNFDDNFTARLKKLQTLRNGETERSYDRKNWLYRKCMTGVNDRVIDDIKAWLAILDFRIRQCSGLYPPHSIRTDEVCSEVENIASFTNQLLISGHPNYQAERQQDLLSRAENYNAFFTAATINQLKDKNQTLPPALLTVLKSQQVIDYDHCTLQVAIALASKSEDRNLQTFLAGANIYLLTVEVLNDYPNELQALAHGIQQHEKQMEALFAAENPLQRAINEVETQVIPGHCIIS